MCLSMPTGWVWGSAALLANLLNVQLTSADSSSFILPDVTV